ncbi:aspartate aminotransferase [Nostoc sp. CALU 546]|uniref:aspartate aminotransferase n=1 Tax=Nostoc sp. CALU 546 TaxID=1867241 RepID=UPI003B66FED7
MLGVKLEETRVYQEAKQEGREELKLELVPPLLACGMSMEQVAQLLSLTIKQVRIATEQESSTST